MTSSDNRSETILRQADAPFHVIAKAIGPICNLDCKYCFYLEKEQLYPENEKWKMSDEQLEAFIRDYIAAQPSQEVSFAFQGGEPTLLGVITSARSLNSKRSTLTASRSAPLFKPMVFCSTMNGVNFWPRTSFWSACRLMAQKTYTTHIASIKKAATPTRKSFAV